MSLSAAGNDDLSHRSELQSVVTRLGRVPE